MQSNKSSYSSVLIKRMEERIEEGVHAALLILTAIHDDHRIAELADHLITTKEIKQKALAEIYNKRIEQMDPQSKELLLEMMDYMEKKCISVPIKKARASLL